MCLCVFSGHTELVEPGARSTGVQRPWVKQQLTVCACSPPHCKHVAAPLMSPHCTSHLIVFNETISISHSSSLALHPPPPVLPLSLNLLFSSRKAPANRPRKPNSPSFHRNKPVPSLSTPLPPVPELFLSPSSLCPLRSLPPHPPSLIFQPLSPSLSVYCWWLVGFTAPLFWYLHISGGCRIQRLSGERTLSLPLPNASLHLPTHTHTHTHTHIWGEHQ